MPSHRLREGALHTVTLSGWSILLSRHEGAVCAVVNACTHASSALSEGHVRRGWVICPLHGARFELQTGVCAGQTYPPLRTFPTRLSDGWIEIGVPREPPGIECIPVASRP